MIRADEHLAVHGQQRVYRLAHTFIHSLYRLNRRRKDAGVSDHVRIRKVNDNYIILSGGNRLHQLVRNLIRAHLRLKIIRRHLRGVDQNSVLALIRLLNAAVEEEGNMRVLLCLGNSGLCHMVSGQILAERIVKMNLLKSDQLIRNGRIIIREADIG